MIILSEKPLIRAYLGDCNEILKATRTNEYDLAITDPPYGIGISDNPVRQKHNRKKWDSSIPEIEYFDNLMRVSKNQIVWGGNYFPLKESQGFIIWDKKQPEDFSLAMCEFAWSSFQQPAKIFRYSVQMEKGKIHPTQKPVQLYRWILSRYAKAGQKILDTHGGSFSSAVACHMENFDLDIIEIDEEYFNAGIKRFKRETRQLKLF